MRGTAYMRDWENRMLQERLDIMVTARCYFCSWQQEGTVRDTQEAFLEHRRLAHPQVQPPVRRKRHRPYGMVATRPLEDNIAAARAQGAAGWAAPE